MRREAVDLESIASIGYAARGRALEIEFRESRDVYRYFEVSAEEHPEFMAAPSKGSKSEPGIQGEGAPLHRSEAR